MPPLFSTKKIFLLLFTTTLILAFCLSGEVFYSYILHRHKSNPSTELSRYESRFLRHRVVDQTFFSRYGFRVFQFSEVKFIELAIERLYATSDPFLLLLATESHVRNGDFDLLPEISAAEINKGKEKSDTLMQVVFSVIGADNLAEHVDIKRILTESDARMVCALAIIANQNMLQEYKEAVKFMLTRKDIHENCKQRVQFLLSDS